jgi:Predicted RNA-binding protein homologous to eukaryotic snRNP
VKFVERKKKQAMSALDILAFTIEIQSLLPARVNGVHAPHERAVVLELYTYTKGQVSLVLDASGFCFVSQSRFKTITKTKILEGCAELKGAWLKRVYQLDFDRVAVFEFSNEMSLVYELLAKGNLILLKKTRVISALEYVKVKERAIQPGEEYKPPPVRGASLEQAVELKGKSAIQALSHAYNAPLELLEEALFRLGISTSSDPTSLDTKAVTQVCLQIIEEVKSAKLAPNLVYAKDAPIDFHPIVFQKDAGFSLKFCQSFSEAIAEYYEHEMSEKASQQAVRHLLEKVERTLSSAKKSRELSQTYFLKAKLLREVAQKLVTNHDFMRIALLSLQEKKVDEAVGAFKALGFEVVEANPVKLVFKADGETFELDPRLKVFQSASEFFESAKQLERKAQEALRVAQKLEEEAEKLRQQSNIEIVRSQRTAVVKKRWFEKYRWFFTSEGLLVIAGRDASQNQAIARKLAKPGYTALHADIQGAPFTLILGKPNEHSLLEAAQFAASYSKAWEVGASSVDVFYADCSKISLSAPSGEFLPKGGIMFHEKNYIRGVPLGLSLGFVELAPNEVRVSTWPSLKRSSEEVARLEPNGLDKNSVAKKLLKLLQAARDDLFTRSLRVDDLLPLIPGRSKIVN